MTTVTRVTSSRACRGRRRHGGHPGHRRAPLLHRARRTLAALERLRAGFRSAAAKDAAAARKRWESDQSPEPVTTCTARDRRPFNRDGPDLIMIFNNQSPSTRRALSTSAISPRRSRARKRFYKYSRPLPATAEIQLDSWTIVGAMNASASPGRKVGVTKFPERGTPTTTPQEVEGKGPSVRPGCQPFVRRPPTFVYPLLWSYGGKEVEADRGRRWQSTARTRSTPSSS